MKKFLKILGIIVGTLLILLISGVSLSAGWQVVEGTTRLTVPEETIENDALYLAEINFDQAAFYEKYQVNEVEITSSKKIYEIPALHISADGDYGKDTAVLVHDLDYAKKSVLSVAELFLELGYNVVIYDQLNSGENTYCYNTIGVQESIDTLDVVRYVDDFLTDDNQLVVWGTAYGGGTAAIALGRDDRLIDRAILLLLVSLFKVL